LNQTPYRIETTKIIKRTEAPREDEMGTRVADHRFTRLLVTHLDRMIEIKVGLSLSTG
jgi:hypothetical protein